MKVALLSPIAWRTSPSLWSWENIVWLLADGLVKAGIDVTLFATADSRARISWNQYALYHEEDRIGS